MREKESEGDPIVSQNLSPAGQFCIAVYNEPNAHDYTKEQDL